MAEFRLRSAKSTTLLRKPVPGFISEDIPLPIPQSTSQSLRRVHSSTQLSPPSYSSPTFDPLPLPTPTPNAPPDETQPDQSVWGKALSEAHFFTTGLVSSPVESTRQYSVIRHSAGLTWYKGPSTSICISILSASPIPPCRTVWLQQRGHSGNTGMAIKAVLSTKSWIDVTPQTEVHTHQLDANDERSTLRDFKRFAKRTDKYTCTHTPRQTYLLRIPATCSDGYFRAVVCSDNTRKHVLCASPVFRVASTSSDISVLRGASLSTAPIEMGVKVASTIGSQVAKRYAGVAGAVIKSRAGKVVTHKVARKVGGAAYTSAQESWTKSRQTPRTTFTPATTQADTPMYPFPVKISGTAKHGVLVSAPDWILSRAVAYMAWVHTPTLGDWHESIVTVAPREGVAVVARENVMSITVLDDETVVTGKVKVLVMDVLRRPDDGEPVAEDEMDVRRAQDIYTVLSTLQRDAWAPELAVEQTKSQNEASGMDSIMGKVVQQFDKVPVHWAGVRSEAAVLRDHMYGNGGLWVQR